ncbi:MAG: hypothetical protein U0235_34625 [Polyangiaceae bacterium]
MSSTCPLLKPACVQFACTACDAQTGNVFVVDPNGGSDGAPGSGMAAGVASPACAFKTVEHALGHSRGRPGRRQHSAPAVRVIGPATITNANDVVPVELVDNVALEHPGVVVSFGASEDDRDQERARRAHQEPHRRRQPRRQHVRHHALVGHAPRRERHRAQHGNQLEGVAAQ